MANLADTIRSGVSSGLDFVTLDELRKRTGITPESVLPFALSEMLCNALDKDAPEIRIDVQNDGEFDRLTISDNGSKKLTLSELRLIFDFAVKASSKRDFLKVSRGYLGNALKCIIGYSYALACDRGLAPPPLTVASGSLQYTIALKPDRIRAVIDKEILQTERQDDGFTVFAVRFPKTEDPHGDVDAARQRLKSLILASSMVNPTRKISFNLHGECGTFGTGEKSSTIRQETSAAWYTLKQFMELFEDFLRASPDSQLKDFISMFRGFSGRKAVREILQELNAVNHDSENEASMQFFPTSTLKELPPQRIEKLLVIMKARTKPISKRSIPAVLGNIGQDNFSNVKERNRWSRLRYVMLAGVKHSCSRMHWPKWEGNCENPNHVEYPYLVELAVIDRNDGDGLYVYQCVNFMASIEPVFSSAFDVKCRLGRVGINTVSPVTIIVHLVCPVLPWLNYGKSTLANIDSSYLIEKAFDKLLPIPKAPKEYRAPSPPRPLSWVPHGKIGDPIYEARLKSFAAEIKVIKAQRTHPVKPSSRGWCYLIEQHGKIDKGEFDACQKAINDCRKIGLLPIDFVAEDQDTTRHFKGIHNISNPAAFLRQIKNDVAEMLDSLTSSITDYWIGEKFYLMMCVEKGGLLDVFKPICDEYHVPIVSSKGWPPILLRSHIGELSKKAEAIGLTPVLLLFYDYDPSGMKITRKFRKTLEDCKRGMGWSPDKLIIERFGLNREAIDKYNLTWIENLITGSDKEPRPSVSLDEYIQQAGGRRKCEADALFKSDETLKAAEEICRRAIEKYYAVDALERFRAKEWHSKEQLSQVYDNPVWKSFKEAIDRLQSSFNVGKQTSETLDVPVVEKEIEVSLDNKYYGSCPRCRTQFNYSEEDAGKLVRCRNCALPMRLKNEKDVPDLRIVLPKEECAKIVELSRQGKTLREIAAEYKITEQRVSEILNNEGNNAEGFQ